MRRELESALMQARTLTPAELPRFLGELEQIRVTAMARLITPAATEQPDEMLSVEETARRLGVSEDYLYHSHRRLPFTRRVGRRLLFSSAGLEQYLKTAKR